MERSIDTRPFFRQLDILAPDEITKETTIIGAGGIGSPVMLMLIKMGFPKLRIFDPDIVEEHNVPNQLYGFEDSQKKKVDALADNVNKYMYSNQEATYTRTKWNGSITPIIISAVDSMGERIKIWKKIKDSKFELYVDARMGGELMRIYTVQNNASSKRFYETTLHSSAEADEVPCTARAVLYNIFIISGLIGMQLAKFIKKKELNKELIFDLTNVEFIKS